MNALPDEGFLRLKQIVGDSRAGIPAIVPVSKSSWWSGVASGRFPKPVKLGERTTAWTVASIRKLLADLAKAEPQND